LNVRPPSANTTAGTLRRTVQLGASRRFDRLRDLAMTSRTPTILRDCERMLQVAAAVVASCDGGGMK